jgi:hypothetical protein
MQMILTISGFIIAISGLVFFQRIFRDPIFGACYFLVVFSIESFVVSFIPLELGVQLRPMDLVSALFMTIGTYRLVAQRVYGVESILIMVMSVIMSYGLLSGMHTNGFKMACNEARPIFYTLSEIAYFTSFPITVDGLKSIVRCCVYAGICLVCLALFRWTATAVHQPMISQWESVVGNKPYRVLNSDVTIWLLEIGLIVAIMRERIHGHHRLIGYTFVLTALLMAHRSVLIAFAVAATVIIIMLRRQVNYLLISFALSCASFAFLVFALSYDRFGRLPSDASSIIDMRTMDWRLKGYTALLGDAFDESAKDAMIGRSFGSGFQRIIDMREVKDSPHNYFIQIFLRLGFIGLACFILLYAFLCYQVDRQGKGDREHDGWRISMLCISVCQIIYSCGYGLGPEQGLLLGSALATARSGFNSIKARQPGMIPPDDSVIGNSGTASTLQMEE